MKKLGNIKSSNIVPPAMSAPIVIQDTFVLNGMVPKKEEIKQLDKSKLEAP